MTTKDNHTKLAGFVEVDRVEIGWLSLEQARLFCECGDDRIRQAVRADILKAFVKRQRPGQETQVYRKGWHFDRDALAAWMAAGKPIAVAPKNGHPLLAESTGGGTTKELDRIHEDLTALRLAVADCLAGIARLEALWRG